MSQHLAQIRWRRTTPGFGYAEYNRRHEWRFDGGSVVPAASAPEFRGDPDCVDPEEAFTAALSSCHMLWFLHLASDGGFVVDAYEDDAIGVMEKADDGKLWLSRVILRPRAAFTAGRAPEPKQLETLHHQAHENCFLARSVKTVVTTDLEPST